VNSLKAAQIGRAPAALRQAGRARECDGGADCGFSSQAHYRTEVHRTVVWKKFKAMREGVDIASKRLWN
jgi:hypothetical protein